MPAVSDLVRALDSRIPFRQAADWDNVGLHVGDGSVEVTGVLVALDATPQTVAEAAARGANVLLTHHPLLFKPVKRFTDGDPTGGLALKMAQAGVAHVAAHTNLDTAAGGVSVALAHQIGLEGVSVLAPLRDQTHLLTVYVPRTHAGAVREALARAGAGRVGAYDAVSFSSEGTGRFTPGEGARPAIGSVGEAETVEEVRIEAMVSSWVLPHAITAAREVHSYEEVVLFSHPVSGIAAREGYGAVGTLPAPEPLDAFLDRVARALGTSALRHLGDPDRPIRRVAVCGGSGLSFLPDALRAGADAYVTADVTYHRWFEALDTSGAPRLALVDAGHYETEAVAETLLVDLVAESFPDLPVWRTTATTNPMRVHVASGL